MSAIRRAFCAGLLKLVALCSVSPILLSQDWTLTSAPQKGWLAIASSADGATLLATTFDQSAYISTNAGANWTTTGTPKRACWGAASSADGTRLCLSSAELFVSADRGASWATIDPGPDSGPFVCCSADGTRLIVYGWLGTNVSSTVYTSTNSGVDWKRYPAPYFNRMAASADGTKLVAGSSAAGIYTSTNAGATWTWSIEFPLSLAGLASSADGTRLLAATSGFDNGAPIYASTDSGVTWQQSSAPLQWWRSVACSADGTRIIAVGNSAMWFSPDSGSSWIPLTTPGGINAIAECACSADGRRFVAAGQSDVGIYIQQDAFQPSLQVTQSDDHLTLSWLVPSLPFRLQANPDLSAASWIDMPSSSTLDYTNLHYEVTIPKPAGTMFYRLANQ